jgi:hypothetical protein
MAAASMLVTYPFSPASFRARSSPVWSRTGLPLAFFTNRVVLAFFYPAMISLARFSWLVSVLLSRAARLAE